MNGRKPASGVSTAAYAIRVQPKPPNGIREYANSIITQQHAAASGQIRSRPTRLRASPSSPKNSASNTISKAATQTPSTCSQLIATVNMTRPKR